MKNSKEKPKLTKKQLAVFALSGLIYCSLLTYTVNILFENSIVKNIVGIMMAALFGIWISKKFGLSKK
jgi:hypothetical protein